MGHRRIGLFWAVAAASLALPWVIQGEAGEWLRTRAGGVVHDDCKVLSIYDGDTMTVLCDRYSDQPRRLKVRLYCIDAPEMGQKPWGSYARDRLRAITPPEVRLLVLDRDRFGRTVADVLDSGQSLNLRMVSSGHAAVYRHYCDDSRYVRAEQRARGAGAGLWRVEGQHQRPWQWRAGK